MNENSPEADTSKKAFEMIRKRLKDDVGNIIELIKEEKKKGAGNRWHETAPYWAVARMLFPIAESVGCLLHGKTQTDNLVNVLEHEFESVYSGYNCKGYCIAMLFRNSLTHTDVLCSLEHDTKKLYWRISWNEEINHLKVEKTDDGQRRLTFDTTAFYVHLLEVLDREIAKDNCPEAKTRYNRWLNFPLVTRQLNPGDNPSNHHKTVDEIKQFFALSGITQAKGVSDT